MTTIIEKNLNTSYSIWNNARFYILATSLTVSLLCIAWLRITIESDQLFYIRTQQVMGMLSLVYWYVALLISPLVGIFGKQRMAGIVFSRRAIGVSAAYFALLHACIALWGQLGGISSVAMLPELLQTSLVFGAMGVVVLLVMAATSFDAVVQYMTYRRWKWLHRATYIAFVLVILHVWMIGSHISHLPIQYTAAATLLVLASLESYRALVNSNKKWQIVDGSAGMVLLMSVVVVTWFSVMVLLTQTIDSYHMLHHEEVHESAY